LNNSHIILREWRLVRKKTLVGFATVELPIGLVISDVAIHHKNNRWWANLPGRPVLDATGQPMMSLDGRRMWVNLLACRDPELAAKFSTAVISLVRSTYPADFGDLA
jgi:hypothetical protein